MLFKVLPFLLDFLTFRQLCASGMLILKACTLAADVVF